MNGKINVYKLSKLLLLFVIFSPLLLPVEDDIELNVTGILNSRPTDPTDTWIIDGVSFAYSSTTILEEEHGSLTVGTCAEVSYVSSSDFTAIKIESRESLECDVGDG